MGTLLEQRRCGLHTRSMPPPPFQRSPPTDGIIDHGAFCYTRTARTSYTFTAVAAIHAWHAAALTANTS
jgi:hypothetical protein